MACGGAAASSACTRKVRFPATGRDTGDGPSGSAELSRRARLQPEVVVGAGGGSRRRRSSGRGADYTGHRSSSVGYDANYDPDNDLPNSNIQEDSSTSSDDESVARRKKMLEDALFGFFKDENNRLKVPGVGRDVFSVYSTKYFGEILKRMSIGRKDVISKYGFDYLLKFEKTQLPFEGRATSACPTTAGTSVTTPDHLGFGCLETTSNQWWRWWMRRRNQSTMVAPAESPASIPKLTIGLAVVTSRHSHRDGPHRRRPKSLHRRSLHCLHLLRAQSPQLRLLHRRTRSHRWSTERQRLWLLPWPRIPRAPTTGLQHLMVLSLMMTLGRLGCISRGGTP